MILNYPVGPNVIISFLIRKTEGDHIVRRGSDVDPGGRAWSGAATC